MSIAMIEEEDFYYNEQGMVVLTESYHLKKGFCCGNGCLHCPYDYVNVPEPAKSNLILSKENAAKENNTSRS
ncbi:MAG: DUF5522 domain-containing protein [Ferruginibacter sp.]